jgi:hypothetical protein
MCLGQQFLSFSYLFCFAQNNPQKTCYSIAETLIFMTMQLKITFVRPDTITYNGHGKIGLPFSRHPVYDPNCFSLTRVAHVPPPPPYCIKVVGTSRSYQIYTVYIARSGLQFGINYIYISIFKNFLSLHVFVQIS